MCVCVSGEVATNPKTFQPNSTKFWLGLAEQYATVAISRATLHLLGATSNVTKCSVSNSTEGVVLESKFQR